MIVRGEAIRVYKNAAAGFSNRLRAGDAVRISDAWGWSEMSQPVTRPGGNPHPGRPVAVHLRPDAIPEQGSVTDVLERLALRQPRFGAVWLLEGRHEFEVGNGFFEMQRVVAHNESVFKDGRPPVIRLVVILAVEAQEHIAAIP